MEKPLLIFDYHGTLSNRDPEPELAIMAAFKLKNAKDEIEESLMTLRDSDNYYAELLNRIKKPINEYTLVLLETILAREADKSVPINNIQELFRKVNKYQIALIANTYPRLIRPFWNKYGIAFAGHKFSYEIFHKKPDKEIFEELLNEIEIPLKRKNAKLRKAIMIGDSDSSDMQGARKADIQGVLIKGVEDFSEQMDNLLESLEGSNGFGNYYSDGLRVFKAEPLSFNPDKMKESINLTFSFLLKNNKKILDEIKKIIKQFPDIQDEIVDNEICLCKEDWLHFSVINFLTVDNKFDRETFENKYSDIIERIKKVINEEFKKIDEQDKTLEFRWIYTGDLAKPKVTTIAIQAYPSYDYLDCFLSIKKRVQKEIFEEQNIPFEIKIKGYPEKFPRRFAFNIVRFFRKPTPGECESLKKAIGKINRESDKDIIESVKTPRFDLVISNQYLSNPNPELTDGGFR